MGLFCLCVFSPCIVFFLTCLSSYHVLKLLSKPTRLLSYQPGRYEQPFSLSIKFSKVLADLIVIPMSELCTTWWALWEQIYTYSLLFFFIEKSLCIWGWHRIHSVAQTAFKLAAVPLPKAGYQCTTPDSCIVVLFKSLALNAVPYRGTEQALSMAAFTQRTEGLFSGSAWCPFQCIQAVKVALITYFECVVGEFT